MCSRRNEENQAEFEPRRVWTLKVRRQWQAVVSGLHDVSGISGQGYSNYTIDEPGHSLTAGGLHTVLSGSQ